MTQLSEQNRSTSKGTRRRLLWFLAPGLCLIAMSGLSIWNWQGMFVTALDGLDGWVLDLLSGSASGGPSSNVAQPPAKFVPLADDLLQVVSVEPDASPDNSPGPRDEFGERIAGKVAESHSMSLLATAAASAEMNESAEVLGRVVLAGVALEGVKEGDVYELRAGHLQRMLLLPDVNGQFELAGMLDGVKPVGDGGLTANYGRLRLDAAGELLDVLWRESAEAKRVVAGAAAGQELTAVFLHGTWKDVTDGRAVEFEPGEAVEEQLGRLLAGELATAVRAQLTAAGVDADRLRVELLSAPRSCLKIHGDELRWVLRSPLTITVTLQPRVTIL